LESDCDVNLLTYSLNVSPEFLGDVDLAVNGLGKSVSIPIQGESVDNRGTEPIALFEKRPGPAWFLVTAFSTPTGSILRGRSEQAMKVHLSVLEGFHLERLFVVKVLLKLLKGFLDSEG